VADAEIRFSELLEQSRQAPQTITRDGRRVAVVVSLEEWDRRAETLADLFAASPLRGSGLRVARSKDRPRDVDL
jgi:prevent-host-death family protein